MLRNYLAAAFRNVVRNRLTTFLNVIGLATGLAAALLALLFVRHELSYDSFIPGSSKVAALVTEVSSLKLSSDMSPAHLAAEMKADFPGLETARLRPTSQTIRRGDVEAIETVGWADANFFTLLPLPVVAGNLATALDSPDAVVLTRRMARKYFGRDNPIGETLEVERAHVLQVTAVIEDLPAATHLSPEIYGAGRNPDFGIAPLDEKSNAGNLTSEVVTYVTPSPSAGMSLQDLQHAMPDFIQRHLKNVLDMGVRIAFVLVPVPDLHLYPSQVGVMKAHGSPAAVAAVGSAGMLIVLVALINFVNLMTGRYIKRAVEVGVRKVSGADRLALIAQFVGEGLLSAAASLALAVALVQIVLPAVDANLAPGIAEQWITRRAALMAVTLTLIVGVLGGLYPAFILAGLRPAKVLKDQLRRDGSGKLRQALVLLQFGILIGLMFATLVIYRQTSFALRDGLRADHEQMLLLFAPCRDNLVNELRALPGVAGLACSRLNPVDSNAFTVAYKPDGSSLNVGIASVGFGYLELYGLRPLAGRFFDPARDSGLDNLTAPRVVLNETGVRALGFASPEAAIGQTFKTPENRNGPPSEVIGVVPDLTFALKTMRIPPTMYVGLIPSTTAVISLKLSGREVPETLDAIDAVWKRLGEPRPIKRSFVDEQLQAQYVQTIRQGWLIAGLSATAVVIACLGLFGLASFTAEQRTKEIGIRKAMGARTRDVLRLLLWQFTKPVLTANVVAWPAGYLVMRHWLEGFAYHIDLEAWMFLGASTVAVMIAVATVAGHALLVARAQPVKALRYE